jgi:hypothetical protein
MGVRLLIDAIVRQTTVLIAQLSTSGGLRAPLAHVAGQVFLELARELENQGVPTKVRADMFGLALRTYQRRTQRLAQSRTDQGRSLWGAVFEYLGESPVVAREELFRRFRHDDDGSVRGVLRDLVESGLVFASGSGRSTVYRRATDEELGRLRSDDDGPSRDAFVWSVVFRTGPTTAEGIAEECGLARAEVDQALASLVSAGRVEAVAPVEGASATATTYRSRELVIPLDDPIGWEAAVQDHYSACVKTIAGKLRVEQTARLGDQIGGSTYHFTIWRGHPHEDEVLGELRRFRERMTALRARVDRFNGDAGVPAQHIRVDAYYGQCLVEDDEDDSLSNEDNE